MRSMTLGLALVGALSLTVPARAFFEANVAAGYTQLNPSQLNDALTASTTNTNTPIKSGFYVSADAGVPLMPFLKLSPRVVYVSAAQGSTNGTNSSTTVDMNIVPLELGLMADFSAPLTGLSVRAGAWGGYAPAVLSVASKNNGVLTSTSLYQGSAFSAEVLGAVRYGFLPFLSLSLEAGYRLANVTEMQDSGGNKLKSGVTNSAMAVDFSGINLGGGLTFSF